MIKALRSFTVQYTEYELIVNLYECRIKYIETIRYYIK